MQTTELRDGLSQRLFQGNAVANVGLRPCPRAAPVTNATSPASRPIAHSSNLLKTIFINCSVTTDPWETVVQHPGAKFMSAGSQFTMRPFTVAVCAPCAGKLSSALMAGLRDVIGN
ncbi:hypothetical protein [Mycolicibacterium sp. P9-22]|uniref:hypothetical protein n=1 Tax=Mycolicibacterium sp. P9-22 TaxID=2024613 RepID=UPI0011EF0CD0|nr:hypothetical protein [Mycolicibacterium sp. P9-22]